MQEITLKARRHTESANVFGTFVLYAQKITSLTRQEVSPSDVWSYNVHQVGFDLQAGPGKRTCNNIMKNPYTNTKDLKTAI